jgi:hypothetical protein
MSLGGSQEGGLNLNLLSSDGGSNQLSASQTNMLGNLLLGSMMGLVDSKVGNAAAGLPSQPSTDELMAAPPLLVTNVGNFGKSMVSGLGGGSTTQALLAGSGAGPGSSEMTGRHPLASVISTDETIEMHKSLLSSSADSTGRHFHLPLETGSIGDSLVAGQGPARFLASRSQDESSLRRIGRLTMSLSQSEGTSSVAGDAAHTSASSGLIESMTSRMMMGQAAAAAAVCGSPMGSMDICSKTALLGGMSAGLAADPLQRCFPGMFPTPSQTSGSIENVANFMQVIEMQSLLAASNPPHPFASSSSSSSSSAAVAVVAAAAAAALAATTNAAAASPGQGVFARPDAPTAGPTVGAAGAAAVNSQVDSLHATAARKYLSAGEGGNYNVGAKRGGEVLEEIGAMAASKEGGSKSSQAQSKGSGAHVKNRPDMQKRARKGQEHWLAKVKKMREEWSSHEACSSNLQYKTQIEGCQSMQTRSQHECILRTLQIACADGQITSLPFASFVDNTHSFLGWTGFQVGAPRTSKTLKTQKIFKTPTTCRGIALGPLNPKPLTPKP